MPGTITIPDPDEDLRRRLEQRAAKRGRTVEGEAQAILSEALGAQTPPVQGNLADAIRAIVEPYGGFDIPEIPDTPLRDEDFPNLDQGLSEQRTSRTKTT